MKILNITKKLPSCGHRPPPDAGTCPACGSARSLRHAELHNLAIAHLDCDAFYAAIEKRDRPELRDLPVLVGGRHRGVVAACCYIARAYGVRSAMPMSRALRACPDAVVIKPDMKKYAAVGREVRTMMLALTPLIEPLSIDEAFMDYDNNRADGAASVAENDNEYGGLSESRDSRKWRSCAGGAACAVRKLIESGDHLLTDLYRT